MQHMQHYCVENLYQLAITIVLSRSIDLHNQFLFYVQGFDMIFPTMFYHYYRYTLRKNHPSYLHVLTFVHLEVL